MRLACEYVRTCINKEVSLQSALTNKWEIEVTIFLHTYIHMYMHTYIPHSHMHKIHPSIHTYIHIRNTYITDFSNISSVFDSIHNFIFIQLHNYICNLFVCMHCMYVCARYVGYFVKR